jgi:hypothetical protein
LKPGQKLGRRWPDLYGRQAIQGGKTGHVGGAFEPPK